MNIIENSISTIVDNSVSIIIKNHYY